VSRENVEIVRRARKHAPGDAEFFSPDVVYRPIAIWADSQECRGLDELRRFHENIAAMFAGLRVDSESYHARATASPRPAAPSAKEHSAPDGSYG
jgi:hypothetical protein